MKCLQKYKWMKLFRCNLPEGCGIMGSWLRLASRAAFRQGNAYYCGHINPVTPGMWSGGIVGPQKHTGRQKAFSGLTDYAGTSGFGIYHL